VWNFTGKHLNCVTIDCRPDVVLLAVDLEFRFIDGDLLAILAVRLEEVGQPMKPLSDCLVKSIDERFDSPILEASMVQKRREDTPLGRRVLTVNTCCWRAFSIMRYSIAQNPTFPCSAASFTLRLKPLPRPSK
jgi:hypothetical protein